MNNNASDFQHFRMIRIRSTIYYGGTGGDTFIGDSLHRGMFLHDPGHRRAMHRHHDTDNMTRNQRLFCEQFGIVEEIAPSAQLPSGICSAEPVASLFGNCQYFRALQEATKP